MAKDFSKVQWNDPQGAEEMTREELKEKGVTIAGFGLKANQAVYIPTAEQGGKTFRTSIRKGGEKNVPVTRAIIMELVNGKYKMTDKTTCVGVASLANTDYTNKPHEEDKTSAYLQSRGCANHDERVEELGGKVILAGEKEVVIKIQRTSSTTTNNVRTVERLYADDGTPLLRDKRIIPSRILKADEWIAE